MFYTIKFIHIIAVILWLGSLFVMGLLNLLMERKKDVQGLISLFQYEIFIGKFIIGSSSIVAILSGVVLSETFGFGWPLWVIWGLIVFFISGVIGGVFIPKMSAKLTEIAKMEQVDFVMLKNQRKRLTALGIINGLLLISAIWVMIFKPL